MKTFDNVTFKGTFRDYQKRVLDNTEKYILSKKINIVAAPGSGKTILGLELIRSLNCPAIILSPTTTIKYQWGSRFEGSFLNENENIDDDFILKAPSNYAPLSFDMIKILLTSKGYHINQNAFESNFSLLMKNGEYNLMAELLSDKNMVPLIFVKFKGYTKASISQRVIMAIKAYYLDCNV